jgi:hypothetical protein
MGQVSSFFWLANGSDDGRRWWRLARCHDRCRELRDELRDRGGFWANPRGVGGSAETIEFIWVFMDLTALVLCSWTCEGPPARQKGEGPQDRRRLSRWLFFPGNRDLRDLLGPGNSVLNPPTVPVALLLVKKYACAIVIGEEVCLCHCYW